MDKKITCPFCGHFGAHICRHNTTFLNPKEKFYWQTAFGDIIILDKYQCVKCYTHFIINPETNTPIAIRRESLFHDEGMYVKDNYGDYRKLTRK